MRESLLDLETELAISLAPISSVDKKITSQTLNTNERFEVTNYIRKNVQANSEHVRILETTSVGVIDAIIDNSHCIINLAKINDVRYIDTFLDTINSKIHANGMYIGCVETSEDRKERIFNKYNPIYAYPFYVGTFILKRFFPKWKPTRKIYSILTKGKNRFLSLAEVLGRLVSSGFSIFDYKKIGHLTYFVVKKTSFPLENRKPSKGIFIRLKRVGADGKLFNVYKFRTMHPYAEYLQSYVYDQNNLKEGGKFKNDFRITTIGKTFRKLWIDELPMLVNLLKGDLKLIGVRPLSKHYLSLYNDELRKLRKNIKPGLLPPFYADLPKSLDEIMESEKKYLTAYKQNPIKTDIKYLGMILKNIIFRKARSA
jgi:lipopolysaccharide/colanic/teichoic acid biosynthesis glycosyltransferase